MESPASPDEASSTGYRKEEVRWWPGGAYLGIPVYLAVPVATAVVATGRAPPLPSYLQVDQPHVVKGSNMS